MAAMLIACVAALSSSFMRVVASTEGRDGSITEGAGTGTGKIDGGLDGNVWWW